MPPVGKCYAGRMGRASGYEFFEHTADVGIRAWGPDLAATLTQAARALMELLTGGEFTSTGDAHYDIALTADSVEDLAVCWLQELLVRFDTEHLVPQTCDFQELTPQRLRATIWAQRCDPAAERLGREVKAITYHQLRLEQTDGYRLEVIVDI